MESQDALFLMLIAVGPMAILVGLAAIFEGPTLRKRPGYSGACKKLKG